MKAIYALGKQMGHSPQSVRKIILNTTGHESFRNLSAKKASEIIQSLKKKINAKKKPLAKPENKEEVDVDEVAAGIDAQKNGQADKHAIDEIFSDEPEQQIIDEPRATTGDIKLFKAMLKRRADQSGKKASQMQKLLLGKLGKDSLENLTKGEIVYLNDILNNLNKTSELLEVPINDADRDFVEAIH